VAQPKGTGARWCTRRSLASGHSEAWKLTGGGTTERGEHGMGLTGARAVAWRPGDDGETAMVALRLQKRGRVRWGRCDDLQGRGGLFIGPGEGAPRRGTRVTAGVNAST
jgi:hypothetical protein